MIELHTVNELRKHNILKGEKDPKSDSDNEKSINRSKNDHDDKNSKHAKSDNTLIIKHDKIITDNKVQNKANASFVSNLDKHNQGLGLKNEQANIMIAALEIGNVKAKDLLIPIDNMYMIDYHGLFTKEKVEEIMVNGYSRIPVFKHGNKHFLSGILRTKNLIGNLHKITLNEPKIFSELNLKLSKPIIISPELSLINLLREFRNGRSHMAFVTNSVENFQRILGLDENNSELSGVSKFSVVFNNDHDKTIEILG